MPLDHYVSQVHLRNFYSPKLNGMMYAIRKSDLKCFTTKSQDVCRIENNSTNAYLREDRTIEAFLRDVEPRYNESVTKIRDSKIDTECVRAIAGFAAYVVTCSPAAMRMHSAPLKVMVDSTAKILDAQGEIPRAPETLGDKSITELLSNGTVTIKVDPKFPQAIGISNILHYTSVFGNSPWEILRNNDPENPFFTSDYPAAIEVVGFNNQINRVVPLAPDVAIRIKPDRRLSRTKPNLSFPGFEHLSRQLRPIEIVSLNRLLVQCAEDLVFYRNQRHWIKGFVAKNRKYRVDTVTETIEIGSEPYVVSTLRIRAKPQ